MIIKKKASLCNFAQSKWSKRNKRHSYEVSKLSNGICHMVSRLPASDGGCVGQKTGGENRGNTWQENPWIHRKDKKQE